MKKFSAILLICVMIFGLISCSEKYKPVKSTKEESKVVLTLSLDGEEYDIKYELYRAFFLNFKNEVDGGDSSVWSGENAREYIEKINDIIIENSAEIYSAFHHAKAIGIDPYSKEFEEEIAEYVRIGVEGNGDTVKGHGGDYDKYLNSLKEMNFNYSVSELLIRYQLTLNAIDVYYGGRVDEVLGNLDGEYEINGEDVKNYYFSDECARVLHIFYGEGVKTDEELEKIREAIREEDSDLDVALYIINHSIGLESELIKDKKVSGTVIGKYSLNELYYSEYTKAALSLCYGEVSEIIDVKGENAGSYIIYKLEKTDAHFSDEYEVIEDSYIANLIGKKLEETKNNMAENVDYTSSYQDIDHKSISMN